MIRIISIIWRSLYVKWGYNENVIPDEVGEGHNYSPAYTQGRHPEFGRLRKYTGSRKWIHRKGSIECT